jgi:hypothetical protein
MFDNMQVAGTLGRRLLAGQRKGLTIDSRTTLDVNCKVGPAGQRISPHCGC